MIPLSELKAYLGIEATDQASDVALFEMEKNAVAFVETHTHRYFGPPAAFEEIIVGDGTRKLWLAEPPLPDAEAEYGTRVGTVEERSVPGADPVLLEERTDFEVRTPGHEGILVRWGGNVWTRGYEYTVTYWRGYPYGTEPGDIRQVVLDLCSVKHNQAGQEGVKSETIGGYSYALFTAADLGNVPGAQATLDGWKRLVFA
jgi:hypothetical protein